MKVMLKKVAVAVLIVSMAGCASNTQKQNTTIGALTGGVIGGLAGSAIGAGTGKAVAIGVGILVGALAGGYVGHSVDSIDNQHALTAMNEGKTVKWKNPKTGKMYKMVVSGKYYTIDGNPHCRKYMTYIYKNHKMVSKHGGMACMKSDGVWQPVH